MAVFKLFFFHYQEFAILSLGFDKTSCFGICHIIISILQVFVLFS